MTNRELWAMSIDELRRLASAWRAAGDTRGDLVLDMLETARFVGHPLEVVDSGGEPFSTFGREPALAVLTRYPQHRFALAADSPLFVTYADGLVAAVESPTRGARELTELLAGVGSTCSYIKLRVDDVPTAVPGLDTLLPHLAGRVVAPMIYSGSGDPWLPVLAQLAELRFFLSSRNPSQGFIRALVAEGHALANVELTLVGTIDLELIERLHRSCKLLQLVPMSLDLDLALAVLDRIPDAFGSGAGVIIDHGDYITVSCRFPWSTGVACRIHRGVALLVDHERERVLWSSERSPTFEHDGLHYEWVDHDFSQAVTALRSP